MVSSNRLKEEVIFFFQFLLYLTFLASESIIVSTMKMLPFLLLVVLFGINANLANAIYNPLEKPNNIHGIHILFPSELQKASELVNSTNGEWGYITIPLQVGDRDLVRWQTFMDECKRLKLIPIIRLSTEGDFSNTAVWRIPTEEDILDSANFLDSLNWPIENRYVIVFNEMNRFDEWGGETPDPKRYADLLEYSIDVFKARSNNFFMIMGGLDNSAPNDGVKYFDNFKYLKDIISYKPELFNKIDGFSSHSYPNPGFSRPPSSNLVEGISTYKFEYDLVNSVTSRKIPVFITETGWSSTAVGDDKVAEYIKTSYETIWEKDKDKIVAVTPFLLNSQGGPFDTFSFIKNGQETSYYTRTKEINKTKGLPLFEEVKGVAVRNTASIKEHAFKKAFPEEKALTQNLVIEFVKIFF